MVRFVPDDPFDEFLRVDAVDRLPPRDGLWVAQFQEIVDEARAAYGTAAAAMSIIDDETTPATSRARRRRGQAAPPRARPSATGCIRIYGGLIVGDARPTTGSAASEVRAAMSASTRATGSSGRTAHPSAPLCVFDPEPRDEVDEQDLARLRDLALDRAASHLVAPAGVAAAAPPAARGAAQGRRRSVASSASPKPVRHAQHDPVAGARHGG